jgi:hypothetical protein
MHTVEEFLKKYPLFVVDKKYNGFHQFWDGEKYHLFEANTIYTNPAYYDEITIHELCHFVERPSDKIFLDNLGFPINKIHMNDYNQNQINFIIKTEIRVDLFQITCGINPITRGDKDDGIQHAFRLIKEYETRFDMVAGASEFWQYMGQMVSIYNKDKFWDDLHERYELLEKATVNTTKELALSA